MKILMKLLIEKYHSEQYRNDRGDYLPSKIPYTDHLYGVESILQSALDKTCECMSKSAEEDMLRAALGHDLLEDTDVTESEIKEATNNHVLCLIKFLTNPDDDSHIDKYIEQLSNAPEEAKLIKYADLIENTNSVAYNLNNLEGRWVKSVYLPILSSVSKVLNETEFFVYPKTAEWLRNLLSVSSELLSSKMELQKLKRIPFQYRKLSVQKVTASVSDDMTDAIIERSYNKIRKIRKDHQQGVLDESALKEKLRKVYSDAFEDFGYYGHMSNYLLGSGQECYLRFIDDYRLWNKGEKPCSKEGKPWLYYNKDEEIPEGIKRKDEASYLDKMQFFKLMEAFRMPVERYRPAPKSSPRHQRGFFDKDMVTVFWKDDEGISSDDMRIGDEITLTDRSGIKATFKVMEQRSMTMYGIKYCDYVGIGTIEGYTTSREREILIAFKDDKVDILSTIADDDDMKLFNSYPLWKEYFEYVDDIHRIHDAALSSLLTTDLDKCPNQEPSPDET